MKDKLTYDGAINLILGCMWSGKTSELVRRYKRHAIGGNKCLMIKYKNDTRYDKSMIVTHDGCKIEALVCEYLYEADIQIAEYDVICIDEVQFYKDAHIFVEKWANQGKTVEACGLNGNFNREEFPIISKLIPLAENISFYKAICKETGEDATFTKMNANVDKTIIEVIGGSEKYSATDRETYFKGVVDNDAVMCRDYIHLCADHRGVPVRDCQIDSFIKENPDMTMCQLATAYFR